jgi:outer membrane lipoprotein-sorting protein
MKCIFFILAATAVLLFSHCSVFKKEKTASQLQQQLAQTSSLKYNLDQQWQRLDSTYTHEMVWIEPLGPVKLDSNGFTGQASAIYWRKQKHQKVLLSGASQQTEVVANRQELVLKEKTATLQRQTKSWPWLWRALVPLALLALLVRYLKSKFWP